MKNRVVFLLAIATMLSAAHGFAAVGRTVGKFQVSPIGSVQYAIPIGAPPGPRGVQPTISLVYDSRSLVGPEGVGWNIAGLSAITRCNQTWAQDGAPGPITLAASDGLCMDGKRLRLTSVTYGAASSVYQTEVADFSQVTASSGTTGSGPSYFTVQAKNGLTYLYGYTDTNGNGANSQVIASGSSPATASQWLLSKVIDRAGNNYVINYTTLQGTAVPATIYWTPASAGSSTYNYHMQFNYTSNAPQSSIYGYVAGTPIVNQDLLSSITVAYSGTVVKNYVLAYQAAPTTGREELTSITECADSGATNCLSPTAISYQAGSAGVATSATSTPASTATAGSLHAQWDFNGDGYPDLIYVSGSTVYVSFGSASGFGTPVSTGISAANEGPIGDVLGSGIAGIFGNSGGTWYYYTWNGSSFSNTSTHVSYNSLKTVLVDVNGDGLPDIVTITTNQNGVHITSQLNTSSSGVPSFSTTVNDAFDSTCTGCGNQYVVWAPGDLSPGDMKAWHFDGSDRQGLIWGETAVVRNGFRRIQGMEARLWLTAIAPALIIRGQTQHRRIFTTSPDRMDRRGLFRLRHRWSSPMARAAIVRYLRSHGAIKCQDALSRRLVLK